MARSGPAYAAIAAVAALVSAQMAVAPTARAQGETTRPNPDAQQEVRQYEFMLGRWVGHRIMPGDSGAPPRGTIYWHGTYILDGWAFRTDWEHHFDDGRTQRGTMIRAYDPTRQEWAIAETYSLHSRLDIFTGRSEGNTMIQSSAHDTPAGHVLARRVYFNIRRDSFEDRVENSADNGRTWTIQFRETFERAR